MKQKIIMLLTLCSLYGAAHVSAQCTATLSGSGDCLPVTLSVNPAFAADSIQWLKDNVVIKTDVASWAADGVTVAGDGSFGTTADKVSNASQMRMDAAGNLYILETGTNPYRITKWTPGASSGTTVAQAANMEDFFLDASGNIYAVTGANKTILKWTPATAPGSGATVVSNVDDYVFSAVAGKNDTIYACTMVGGSKGAADIYIKKYNPPAYTTSTTIITRPSGTGASNFGALLLQVMDNGDLYMCDYVRKELIRINAGTTTPVVLLSGRDMRYFQVDAGRNVYYGNLAHYSAEVLRAGATVPDTIAGGNGNGPDPDQLTYPTGVQPAAGGVYVADKWRVQFFARNLNDTLTVNDAGTYKVVAYGGSSCSATTSDVVLLPLPDATITASGAAAFCEGGNVTLTAPAGTGLGYQWLKDGSDLGTSADSLTATAAGDYQVIVTNTTSLCADTSTATTVTVHPLPEPVITDNNGTFDAGTFSTYQWSKNDTVINGATSQTFTPAATGSYTVTVTDGNDCEGTSDPKQFTLGIGNIAYGAEDIRVFPNPATSQVTVTSALPATVSVFSPDGRMVLLQHAGVINIAALAQGIYTLRITDSNGALLGVEKLIKAER